MKDETLLDYALLAAADKARTGAGIVTANVNGRTAAKAALRIVLTDFKEQGYVPIDRVGSLLDLLDPPPKRKSEPEPDVVVDPDPRRLRQEVDWHIASAGGTLADAEKDASHDYDPVADALRPTRSEAEADVAPDSQEDE